MYSEKTQSATFSSSSGRGTGSSDKRQGSGDGSSARGGARRGGRRENLGTIHRDLFTRPEGLDKTGHSGTRVKCMANFVEIISFPNTTFYQYHVGFSPEIDSKQMRCEIVRDQCRQVTGDHVIFDGMIMYAPEDRIGLMQEIECYHLITQDPVKVTIRPSVTFVPNDPQAINIYNLLIRDAFKAVGYAQVARNFFDASRSHTVEKYGVEVWPGYETAIRMYENKLMLCIENRFKVLRKQTVFDMLKEEKRRSLGNQQQFQSNCDMTLCGQTILTLYNNRMHRLTKFAYNMSPMSTFTQASTGKELSLMQYIKETYNVEIKHPDQPIIVSEGKPKQPGEEPQKTYLIPELCFVTGLNDSMRKDTRVMKTLSEYTRLTPEARSASTKEFLGRLKLCDKMQEMFNAWHLKLADSIVELPARELPPETLMGRRISDSKCKEYQGQKAEWAKFVKLNGNFRDEPLVNWIVLAPDDERMIAITQKFIEEVGSLGRTMGMKVAEPMCVGVSDETPGAYLRAVEEGIKRADGAPIHMLVAILVDDNKTRYDTLKKLVCLESPIPSQMVLLNTLTGKGGENKNFSSIVLKILLQMNCKMGGAIWKVNIPLTGGMIVGYDLYHDSTMKGKTVGACVSSYDTDFTKWYSQTRPHETPTELGDNLRIFIKNALRRYYRSNGNTLPLKIIVYRDGCGDGQIPHVRDTEVRQVKEACEEVGNFLKMTYQPKIAFIVVTKKVNMRVFRAVGTRLENPSPGTVVDSVVTRPERYDFYLVPQFVNQGTVTPVCYNVLFDNTGFDPDVHQRLAFKLCHLYYNWQGTVRVPAPCQYAHKLAFLVAQSLHKDVHKDLHGKLFFL